jgi:hypothetical protein
MTDQGGNRFLQTFQAADLNGVAGVFAFGPSLYWNTHVEIFGRSYESRYPGSSCQVFFFSLLFVLIFLLICNSDTGECLFSARATVAFPCYGR